MFITFDEELGNKIPSFSGFTVEVDGSPVELESTTLTRDGIYVTPAEPLPASYSTLTLAYTVLPDALHIEDPAWNKTLDFEVGVPYNGTPPPPPSGPPEFLSTPYVFELPEGRDGSSAPVALGTVEASDPDGGSVVYELVASGDSSRFAVDGSSGAVTYVGPGENLDGGPGRYELTVRAEDSDGDTATASVEIRVTAGPDPPPAGPDPPPAGNDPPLAGNDAAQTAEDTPVTIAVLENDSDPDGDPLTVTEVSAPAHGTAAPAAAGAVLYTPEPNFNGTDRFTYVVGDGSGQTARAAVEVTVLPVDDPPLAVDDAAQTAEDTPVTIAVLENDSDPDGDPLTVAEISAPEHGTAVLAAGGALRYTPERDFDGTDRFTYVVRSGSGLTARAAVEVTVRAVDDPPEAVDDTGETAEDAPVTIAVLANDSDPDGDALTVAEISAPAHGAARLTEAGTVEYTPEPDYHGPDRFTYVVRSGSGLTADAAVAVTVLPVNDPPEAVDDAAETAEDTPVTAAVLANDSDPDGDALTVAEISAPAHGAARLTEAGAVEYTPAPDYHGPDRFTYVVGDGSGLTARASVDVTVLPVNDPPEVLGIIPDQRLEAGDGPASLDLGPYFEDRDGDALGYTAAASDPAVALSLAGTTLTLTVGRPGAATVTVTAQDPGGLTVEQAFLVTTSDRQARGVVEDTLAAMGRGHLASARATLGRRVAATGREESRITVAGMHVPLGTDDAATAGQALAERWITGLAGGMGAGWAGMGAGAGAFGPGGAALGGLGPGGAGGFGPGGAGGFGPGGAEAFGYGGAGGVRLRRRGGVRPRRPGARRGGRRTLRGGGPGPAWRRRLVPPSPACRRSATAGRPSSNWRSARRPAAVPSRGAAGRYGARSTSRRSRARGRRRRATTAPSGRPTWASTRGSANAGSRASRWRAATPAATGASVRRRAA